MQNRWWQNTVSLMQFQSIESWNVLFEEQDFLNAPSRLYNTFTMYNFLSEEVLFYYYKTIWFKNSIRSTYLQKLSCDRNAIPMH